LETSNSRAFKSIIGRIRIDLNTNRDQPSVIHKIACSIFSVDGGA
jgi:hypothetical protein